MKLPLLLLGLSLGALAGQSVCAQSADDFFHSGAQSFLTNNLAHARQDVDEGLKLFLADVKLKKLDELLKRQQNQQQSQQQQQQQQSQSQLEQQKNQKPNEPQSGASQPQQPQPEQPRDKQGEQPKQEESGQMPPEQARQLLDSQKNDEALLPAKPDRKTFIPRRQLRDW